MGRDGKSRIPHAIGAHTLSVRKLEPNGPYMGTHAMPAVQAARTSADQHFLQCGPNAPPRGILTMGVLHVKGCCTRILATISRKFDSQH